MPDVQTRKRRSASFSLGAAPAAASLASSVSRRAAAKHSLQHSSPAAVKTSAALPLVPTISERADNELDVATRHFATLQQLTATHTAPVSVAAANMQRNRYANVVADDVSRVPLRQSCAGSDYVNASRVAARMIATQAPLAHTVEHFWQMVCEERSRVIVCLTKFEIGRAACYFPSAGRTQRYGAVQVTTRGSVQYGRELTVRYLLVQRDDQCGSPPHAVMHLYYSGWPDFGVPSSHEPLLRLFALMHTFDRKLAAQTAHDGLDEPGDERAPFVVHCSAGIGRAGTFIAAALLIEQLLDGSLQLDNDNNNDDDDDDDDVVDCDDNVDSDSDSESGVAVPSGDELHALHLDTTLVDAVLAAMLRPAHSSYVPAPSSSARVGFFASLSSSSSSLSSSSSSGSSSSSAPAALPSQPPASPPRRLHSALFRCVLGLRQRRRGMVQTCEQYRFIGTCVSAAATLLARRQRLADSGGLSSASSDDDFAL